ncbi:TIGR03086 family protein [Streptomyces sulfonofaciens]|uniref:TIGR03086 family protein n=1 Tax=Streptomyces sulfonofaciens TaxID=68272 RepID=A0A919FXC2_9ACTN|nr:TIGR03086 family metal-binding protein [Streptomyces sulfonofaciens]GHH73728.1 TIGR03086 family protein [Streptomyces sulfonofaciens]
MTDGTRDQVPTVDLRPQALLLAELAERVTDRQLADPTPCPRMAVRNLLGHLAGLSLAFRAAGRKELGPLTDTPPEAAVPDVGPDWRATLPKALDELADTWLDPKAWAGQTRAGGVDLPGAVGGLVVCDELVVHGWDLARATGQDYVPDEAALGAAHALLAPAADDPSRGGMFGRTVPVPDDAPLLDRVIGLSGRDPRWSPPR